MKHLTYQRGYLLVTVIVTMFLIATISMLLNHSSGISANTTGGELEAAQADYVAQAAMQNAVWLANQSACTGYALPATSLGTHNYTATFSPANGSPTSIVATGTHASGVERSLGRNNVMIYDLATPMTGTLIPGAEGKDTFIEGDAGHTDHNKGNDNALQTSSATGGELRALLQFDLSGLPPGAWIQSATLELYLTSNTSTDVVEAHRLLRDWTEDGITWNSYDGGNSWSTPGADYDPEIAGSFVADSVGPKSLDITDAAKAWVDGSLPNYGLILLSPPNSGGSTNTYHSSDKTDEPWPRLALTYVCECGTPCPGIAVNQNLVLSTDSDAVLGGLSFTDVDIADYDAASDSATLFFEGGTTSLNSDINAVHVLENGHIVLSTKDAATLGGLSFEDEDLVKYDPVSDTATMYFDGSLHFAEDEDIISVHVLRNGKLILSTDSEATLGGITFSDKDLVKYDPISGNASIYFDGDATSLSQDITAVHVLENGHILMSAKGNTTLGGLSFTPADFVEYDPATDTAIPYFTGSSMFDDPAERIISAHVIGDKGPAGDILLVVGNATSPASKDSDRKALFESWGYTVTLIDDGTSQTNLNNEAAANDVVYVTASIGGGALADKLTDSTAPIVNEFSGKLDNFGFGSQVPPNTVDANLFTTTDATHYISEPFSGAGVTQFSSNITMPIASGTLAPGMQAPGLIGAAQILVTLDAGAARWDMSASAGRRVHLPFGEADISQLTPDGLTLMRRSIEWAAGAGSVAASNTIVLSTETGATLGGLTFTGNDLADYDPDSDEATLYLDGSLVGMSDLVDAVHVLDNGNIVLSTTADASFVGLSFAKEDLIEYDPVSGTATMYLEAAVHFTDRENVISVHVFDNGNIVLSTDSGATLGGLSFGDKDLVEYNRSTGTASIFFDGDATTLSQEIRALHILDNGNFVFAPDADTTLGGLSFGADQLVQYDPSSDTATLYFDGEALFSNTSERIWSLHIGPDTSSPTGPTAHWKLDDGTGTTAVDSEGGHDGTLTNGPLWVTGRLGDALSFDGNNDYVDLTSDAELDDLFDGGATVMAWIEPVSWGNNGYGRIFDKSTSPSSTGDGWAIRVNKDNGGLNFGQGFTGGRGWWKFAESSINFNTWHHVALAYDAGSTANDPIVYLDGSPITVARVDSPSGDIRSDASVNLHLGNHASSAATFFEGKIDDARIYDRMLSDTEIADIASAAGGGGGGGGGLGYNETHEPWSASNNDVWEAADLAPFGVPANAVVEVAVINTDTRTQLWGGVRATGSTLDRRLQLHEAENGGTDVMVMTVQADASSRIEHYADTASTVTFILLGYWGSGSFVESWDLFDAGASGIWTDHALNTYGVAPGSVTEILVHNRSTTTEVQAGVRGNGSSIDRRFEIHEAEGGGRDMFTLLVNADTDAGATIEVFMEHGGGDFYVMGHWSTPPGVFTESYSELSGSPASSATWDDKDLTSLGVPANAVVQIAMANGQDTAEALLGVRKKGSSIDRTLDLQEAEGGGDDFASTHVNADGSSTIQWYDENTGENHRFNVLGWWVLN